MRIPGSEVSDPLQPTQNPQIGTVPILIAIRPLPVQNGYTHGCYRLADHTAL